jgi:DNA-binding IclR family transcriptional regulator
MEQTVRKAFDVLEALAKSGGPRRLTDLSRELSLTKPNVYACSRP